MKSNMLSPEEIEALGRLECPYCNGIVIYENTDTCLTCVSCKRTWDYMYYKTAKQAYYDDDTTYTAVYYHEKFSK